MCYMCLSLSHNANYGASEATNGTNIFDGIAHMC